METALFAYYLSFPHITTSPENQEYFFPYKLYPKALISARYMSSVTIIECDKIICLQWQFLDWLYKSITFACSLIVSWVRCIQLLLEIAGSYQ